MSELITVRNYVQSLINGPRDLIRNRDDLKALQAWVVEADQTVVETVKKMMGAEPASPAPTKKDQEVAQARSQMEEEKQPKAQSRASKKTPAQKASSKKSDSKKEAKQNVDRNGVIKRVLDD